ncbi:MAG: rhodanese-like domain-containing protein [Myxococcota bacterium]
MMVEHLHTLSRNTTPAEVAQALTHTKKPLVLDVREPAEFTGELGHIEGAKLAPLATLPLKLAELSAHRHEHVVVVCRSGGRSARAMDFLEAAGFTRLQNLAGGMLGWNQAGLPVSRDSAS